MRRASTLAAAYLLLAAAATFATGAVPPAFGWPARLALAFGLPVVVGALATFLLPPERGREGASVQVDGFGRFAPLVALAIVADLGAVGVGYLLGWTTFTYGEQRLEAAKLLAVSVAIPASIVAATLGWEWGLRARLYAARAARDGRSAALASIVCGAALVVPAILPGFEIPARDYALAALAVALVREATALALFRAGGLLVAGSYRGALFGLEQFALGDWYGFPFPLANYVSSEPRFYLLRAAGPAVALALVLLLARRRPRSAA